MTYNPYPYRRPHAARYTFISAGKRKVEKVVDFVPIGISGIMNLAFGDLLPDGTVDDKVSSNNGDILKVLTTVVHILKDYTAEYPQIEIFFTGSTDERTRLYTRIIKTYFSTFNKEFRITGLIGSDEDSAEVLFDPKLELEYFAFLIKRIN